ncbi:hypothetical protein COI88_23410 [Bacillus cereus]|nr:hypothetical protein CN390_06810 [Bacillus cereus]PFJ00784.1 hypothetical protein COI88_23410 [Bacillus cereus]PGU36410.1 hypothetical protein COD66_05590 [Bacillus cereus]
MRRKTVKKILLRGYYGYKNSGDDALFYSIVQKIIERENVEINVLSRACLHYPESVKNINFKKPTNTNILMGILKNNILIFGGGSQLQDYGKKKMVLGLFKTYCIVSLSKLLRRKVIYLGISIGPLETSLGINISKKILKKSDYIVVRDKSSFEFLENNKISNDKICLLPDLAISLIDNINIEKEKNSGEIILGINLLPFMSVIRNDLNREKEIINIISVSINKLMEKNKSMQIRLYSFQEDEFINDFYILQELANNIKGNVEIIRYQSNPVKVLEGLSECNRFIGMRLHSSIFAYSCEIPQIILSYHPKCEGFAKSVGYNENQIIDINGLSEDKFSSKMNDLIENPLLYKSESSPISKKREVDSLYEMLTMYYFN